MNFKNINSWIRLIILGWICPVVLSFIVYYGFTTNYSANVFSENGFRQQYENGVYRYRILGRSLLLETYSIIKHYKIPIPESRSIKALGANDDIEFYTAYFYMNTFFFGLTCAVLFYLFYRMKPKIPSAVIDISMLFISSIIAVSQYVVTPYDTLTYFFIVLSVLLTLDKNASLIKTGVLCFIVILATLTRETAILILSFYFTVKYDALIKKPERFHLNSEQTVLLAMTLCLITTYLSLRFVLGFEQALYQFIRFGSNLIRLFPFIGIIFLISIFILFNTNKSTRKLTIIFMLASSPYTISNLILANTWEIRLWVPLIILLVILQTANLHPSSSDIVKIEKA